MGRLAVAVVAVALVGVAVCGAVLALFTPYVFGLLDFHPVALDYIGGNITRVEISQMVIEGQSFGAAEIDHLDDVGALLGILEAVFAACLVIFGAFLVIRPRIARAAAIVALSGLALTGAATVAAYLIFGFVPVGEVFHEVVFPQGNWRFPWYALIIRLYGTAVMVKGAAFVIVAGLGAVLAGVAAGTLLARRRA